MTRKEAINVLGNEKECVLRDSCERSECASCDLVMPIEQILSAYDMAISALREQEELEREQRENLKPLTLDELRKMDGEPVFLVDLDHKSDPTVADLWGGWIVFKSHNQNGFIPRAGGFFSISGYGKTWIAYRSKPKEDAT